MYSVHMPKKGEFGKKGRTQADRDKFVKRYYSDEPVASLIKEFKISRAQAYNWIKRYDEENEAVTKSPAAAEKEEKVSLRKRVSQLEDENKRLLQKVMAMMIKYKEI